MSPPQTNATPMTISPMPRVVICYAKTYSNPVLSQRHLAGRTADLLRIAAVIRPAISGDGWPDDHRPSDIEHRIICRARGKRGMSP
jgi:hypothetical protein